MSCMTDVRSGALDASDRSRYNLLLLCVAGLGGLLYGVDVGIIGGALPYLQATSHFDAGQLSTIVAAVLLGQVISTLFAGVLADWFGRRPMMVFSGLVFAISIPLIAKSQGYPMLLTGRLLQGISGGFIGVIVPLYLAECLISKTRGKGTGIFQWLLTFGIMAAALIGMYYSYRVQAVAATGNADALYHVQDNAWRRIFWISMPPGLLFALGSLFVAESPRWLFVRGKRDKALAALLRSRSPEAAQLEMDEMTAVSTQPDTAKSRKSGSLLRRKYIVPFILACVILACNTATGINSIIGYNTSILLQSGLSDLSAHWGYVVFTAMNFLMTIVGMTLVDRRGRRFLLTLGTTGVMLSLIATALLFRQTERNTLEVGSAIQTLVTGDELTVKFDSSEAAKLISASGNSDDGSLAQHASLAVIYSYGGFTGATTYVRSDDPAALPIHITRHDSIPANRIEAFFKNPFANLDEARTAPLHIERARVGRIPQAAHGRLVALALFAFIACYAAGPGVCVWLALSELMPTRIRSVGMSIALVLNQLVSTTLAVVFLPIVSKYGYAQMFFMFAGFTLVYILTAAFFLPETKGKTLEEVEQYFEGHGWAAPVVDAE